MIGILIIARLGSTRLGRKHLIEVEGKFFIEWLIKRFQYQFNEEIVKGEARIIITTSVEAENKEFEQIASKLGCDVFYGDNDNIPLRQLECAEYFKLNSIISIDGDDILCSANSAFEIYNALNINFDEDYIKTVGLPLGMNVIGYPTKFLKESIQGYSGKKLETGWGRIFENKKCVTLSKGEYDKDEDLRFTLDYQDDANFFKEIISHFKNSIVSATDKEVIEFVISNKVYSINSHLNQEYWSNFNKSKLGESDNN
jgi:spore coat polysaccharide biosynthesis protein SpsF